MNKKNGKYTHDIIIIGAGSGGLNVAGFMIAAGFSVLLIDKSDKAIGGDCLNHGCVPSKAMIHASKLVNDGRLSERFGIKQTGSLDLKSVVKYVKSKQAIIREHENADWFRKKGMDVELGSAKFCGRNSVEINGKEYSAKKIILATGSRPRRLEAPGVEKITYYTNEEIFDLEKLPKRLLVIGGGPIGMEIGQAFSNFGSKVTILERGEKFLPKETPEMANVLYKQLVSQGVDIKFNTSVKEFRSKNTVIVEEKGKERELEFDTVFVGIGRQLNIENLNLDVAGIELDESGRKLVVDDYLRTTNKSVMVCGDIAGGFQFTHAAEVHAKVIITNFFSPLKKKLHYDNFAWVTFTNPQIATFGLSERELEQRETPYEKFSVDFTHDDRAIVEEYTNSKLQIYVSKGKLVGGSMAAPDAGELVQELILAMSAKLDVSAIFSKVYPYPTAGRINKAVLREYFSRKLTSTSKKLMRLLY